MNRRKFASVLLVAALVLVPLLMASLRSVEAAKLTNVSDVLSDSGPGENSDHEIEFTSTSGVSAGQSITVTFDDTGDNFNLGTIGVNDIDLLAGSCGSETSRGLAATPSGATWGVTISTPSDVITFTSGTDTIGAGNCVIVRIGTNASGGSNQIGNPASTGVYDIDLATTSDDGLAKVAIVSHVDVDVTVDETLTFTVTGQTGAAQCNTTATTDSTATAVSFGSVNANSFYTACQELAVSTNASSGYSVTVQQTGELTSAALDTIAKGNCDGACAVGSEAGWATATNNGFGYCVEDISGTDAQTSNPCDDGSPAFRLFGNLGTDTPEVIMSNTGVVSANTIELGFKISVSGSQPAGTYSNEVLYVATPTY